MFHHLLLNASRIYLNIYVSGSFFTCLQFPHGQDTENHSRRSKAAGRKSCSNRIAQKFVKPLNGPIRVSKRAHESVAIANALELFKLIFLNSSKSPMMPSLLAETLRRYSEHDLFSAFNYLREKKIMVNIVSFYY